jgi:hypothetical protein
MRSEIALQLDLGIAIKVKISTSLADKQQLFKALINSILLL